MRLAGATTGKAAEKPMWSVDIGGLFGFSLPIAEIILRGTAVYWFLFLLFRVVVRRDIGAVGLADVLLVVIIADAAQNAMAGGYETVSDGLLLISTIVFWNLALDWLSYRFPRFRNLAQPSALLLIDRGRIVHRNLKHEMIAVEDLMAKLREQGVERPEQVKRAYMESDGTITVIRRASADTTAATRSASRTH
jgi:uncharacterized membrane protein YcaP (DUF421 family)